MNSKMMLCWSFLVIFSLTQYDSTAREEPTVQKPSLPTKIKTGLPSTSYYVAKSGNNRNSGSALAPFLTITKGLSVLKAGDTLFVKGGTYPEYLEFPTSGVAGYPIVLKNYSNDIVIVDGQKSRASVIHAVNKSYLTIDGFKIQNAIGSNLKIEGCQNIRICNVISTLPVDSSSKAINIKLSATFLNWGKNIEFDNVSTTGGQYGLYMTEKLDKVSVSGRFSYAAIDGINMQIPWVKDSSKYLRNITINQVEVDHNLRQGIVTMGLKNASFRNFNAHHNGATGLQIEDFSYNILIEDFICEYNSQSPKYTYETGLWINMDDGVIVRRGILRNNQTGLRVSDSKNVLVYDLLVYSNQDGSSDGNSSGIDFNNSTVEMYNCTIDGNSFLSANRGGVCLRDTGVYVLKNNIISNNQSPYDIFRTGRNRLISDNNLLYNTREVCIYNLTSKMSWSVYQTTSGQDLHSLNTNPLFIGPSDFRLQPKSPAIGAGAKVGLISNFSGNSERVVPDIGAFQSPTLKGQPAGKKTGNK